MLPFCPVLGRATVCPIALPPGATAQSLEKPINNDIAVVYHHRLRPNSGGVSAERREPSQIDDLRLATTSEMGSVVGRSTNPRCKANGRREKETGALKPVFLLSCLYLLLCIIYIRDVAACSGLQNRGLQ